MNPNSSVGVLAFVLGGLSISPGQSPSPPSAPANAARVIGNLSDGSTPTLETPKPGFSPASEDILVTEVIAEGGRTITVQKIKPIALAEPEAPLPALDGNNPVVQARIKEMQIRNPKSELLSLGATVYLSKNAPPRTLATYWPIGSDKPVTFWSSADFSLFSGFSDYIGSDGKTRSVMMAWSTVDMDRLTGSLAKRGKQYQAPDMPELPVGKAAFVISGNPPEAEVLAAIQSLHDLYNNEHDRLKAACESREQARLTQEAELKAHPPQPKNIVLNYWITQSQEKGGDQ